MALNNVFSIGVNGLMSQSNRINGLSNNIANINTVGYKGYVTDFAALVQSNGSSILDSHAGARSANRQLNGQQGIITQSNRSTDIAINGDGFFAVSSDTSDTSSLLFTRAGSFIPDENGNLRNSAGFYLRGWELDTNGQLPTTLQSPTYNLATALSNLSLVNIAAANSIAIPTSALAIQANLNASQPLYKPSGNIQFTNNPTAGDTITVNGVTWTFVASGATGAQTNIGANLNATIEQLASDLNSSTNPSLALASYTNSRYTDIGITHPGGRTVFTSNPTAGSSVVINGVTWTFVASGATGAQTNIGNTLDATLAQLAANLQSSGNPAVSSATVTTASYERLGVAFEQGNASAAGFTLASSSANGVATQMLLYDPTNNANSMASGAITPQHAQPVRIVDNNGIEHTISIQFLKTGTNTWAVEMLADPASDVISVNGRVASGTITFNGNGSLGSVSASLTNPITFPWTDTGTTPAGATTAKTDNTVTFNWGTPNTTSGYSQFSTDYSVTSISQDGNTIGALQRVEVTDGGVVTSFFNNGASRALFVIPIAKFVNPESLESLTGTVFRSSENSGFSNLFASNTGGAGTIISGSLESSTVELSSQLTDMIVAQRAYQSNTKTISTADDMLQTLTAMLR